MRAGNDVEADARVCGRGRRHPKYRVTRDLGVVGMMIGPIVVVTFMSVHGSQGAERQLTDMAEHDQEGQDDDECRRDS